MWFSSIAAHETKPDNLYLTFSFTGWGAPETVIAQTKDETNCSEEIKTEVIHFLKGSCCP